jgi:histidine triad (HIT) family protein
MADDCIFCKIVAGELPSTKIDEDERTLAFMDINPWTRGHALVIPKAHSTDLGEIDEQDLAAVAAMAKRVALRQKEALGAEGVNVLNAFGAAAWQTVFHTHFHVIPRYAGDGMQVPAKPGAGGGPDEIAAAGEALAR